MPLEVWRALAFAFLAARLVLLATMRPYMDETYYFLWGQHPALSYFDHPGLIGWTEGLSALVLGWSMAALRLPVLLTLAGDLVLLHLFARRAQSADWEGTFWPSAALFLSMPILWAVTGVAIPDHLMVFFCLLALYLLQTFLAGLGAGQPRWRWLYAGAVAIGFAMLSKYYGVLIGAALIATAAIVPRYRSLWRSPHFYVAALLALAIQAPVLVWNLQHGWASFGFIVGGRNSIRWWSFAGTPGYLLGILAVVSPFLVWPMLRFATARRGGTLAFPQALFWLSSLAFLAASTVTDIIVHWNALAYAASLPFLAAFVRSRVLAILHFVYAGLTIALFGLNYAVVPLGTLFNFGDQATFWGYGWDDVTAKVRAAETSSGASLAASTDYTITSELGFALHDRNVVSLSPNTDAYDFWTDPESLRGATMVIVADGWRSLLPEIKAHFAAIEEAGSVETMAFGRIIDRYTIFVGRGYTP